MAVTPSYEWNAIPNKHRDHTDDELVDRVFVKKGGDEFAAAINQISLPGCSRSRLTNGLIPPFTNSTPDGASAGGA